MGSVEQNDERRILGQMVRFHNQAAMRIDNDCVNRSLIDLGSTNPRSQSQEKEKKRLFHFAFHAQLHSLTKHKISYRARARVAQAERCSYSQRGNRAGRG
jgi:hypothetical protein